jgi:hypothetical protein
MALLKMFIGGLAIYHVSSIIFAKVIIIDAISCICECRQSVWCTSGRIRTCLNTRNARGKNGSRRTREERSSSAKRSITTSEERDSANLEEYSLCLEFKDKNTKNNENQINPLGEFAYKCIIKLIISGNRWFTISLYSH